ncbi:MAG: radical SAM protein [Planctomycetota bacterium]|jgi:MoaA/NifB/PqqE/SkfB family radical SAM enzyme
MTARERALSFEHYQRPHRERLQALARTAEWQAILARGDGLRQLQEDTKVPPPAPAQQAVANEYLHDRNAHRARKLLDEGVTDSDSLVGVLGNWETALAGDDRFPIVFLGLVLTLDCQFLPRCLYCNQTWLPRRLSLDDWKAILTEAADPVAPYVYVSGGEPLMSGAEVWGDDGLVAFATRLGCAVNINTNAALITPHVALQLVKVGLAKLHISLDTPSPQVQGELLGAAERLDAVSRGIFNIQVAREVLGTKHPQIHINCVLTARNLFQVPDLLRFLLETRRRPVEGLEGKAREAQFYGDFALHLIPVGGSENSLLRPTADEWKRFYTETWDQAERIWSDYQADAGVPAKERVLLSRSLAFANPFLRVEHGMSLDEYCEQAAQGNYWQGALTDRCYVGPTQAFVLPDGSQHWCGAHAIRRPPPLGNVQGSTLRGNIRANIGRWAEYPNDYCTGCAGATCVINQAALRNLKKQVAEWLGEHDSSSWGQHTER